MFLFLKSSDVQVSGVQRIKEMFYFASIKNIENLSANGSMHPNIIGTNSLYRFKQYKVLSCALISDLHFPPLY